ncbi:hypothetical protein Syun_013977 [Stephania yunnanensis]|uniref:Uncharacterized protein n=1 Tax=Stephania yunnanensis TaxID=152371 RepID=A0AAP0P8B3_9MAGN
MVNACFNLKIDANYCIIVVARYFWWFGISLRGKSRVDGLGKGHGERIHRILEIKTLGFDPVSALTLVR